MLARRDHRAMFDVSGNVSELRARLTATVCELWVHPIQALGCAERGAVNDERGRQQERSRAEVVFDQEFGCEVKWDVPLMDGYPRMHVPNLVPRVAPAFFGLVNPRLWRAEIGLRARRSSLSSRLLSWKTLEHRPNIPASPSARCLNKLRQRPRRLGVSPSHAERTLPLASRS